MIATNYLDLDEEYISKVLTDAYKGIKSRFEKNTVGGAG